MKMTKFIAAALVIPATLSLAQDAAPAVGAETAAPAAAAVEGAAVDAAAVEAAAVEAAKAAEAAKKAAEEQAAAAQKAAEEKAAADKKVADEKAAAARKAAEEKAEEDRIKAQAAVKAAEDRAKAAEAAAANEPAPAPMEDEGVLSATVGIEIASATLTTDGSVLTEDAALIPTLSVSTEAFGFIPLTFDVWANYNLADGKKNGAVADHSFSEIDMSIGTAYDICENSSLAFSLLTAQYPNLEDEGEESLNLNYNASFGAFSIGLGAEYKVTGPADGDLAIRPGAAYSCVLDADKGIELELSTLTSYVIQDEGADAWTAWSVKAQLSVCDFYAYVRHWIQMNDTIYTDETNDKVDTVFAVGYQVAL